MTLSRSDEQLIAARATTLQERLDGPRDADPVDSVEDPEELLQEWRRRVADGDEPPFRHRLERDGLAPRDAQEALSAHRPPTDGLPTWVHRLDELVATLRASPSPRFDEPDDEIPFRQVFTRIVDYAGARLDESLVDEQLTASGRAAMDRWLRDRLVELAAHPLFLDFKAYVARRDRELVFGTPEVGPDPPREHYEGFVTDLLADGMRSFFREYAFLGRLLVTTIQQWCSAVEEFCTRLSADRTALRETLGDGSTLGGADDVAPAGDRHHGGRAVLAVTFESGTRVAYKPRSIDLDAAFGEVLDWIDDRSDLGPFRTPDCLQRANYGWVEWVDPVPCQSAAAVERYYRRTGALLAVLYALNFTDGHLENVIAAGDQPVIVDLETLVVPDPPLDHVPRDRGRTEIVRGSVLRTGLVPQHRPELGTGDRSGIGAGRVEVTDAERRTFTDVNTDVMELEYEETVTHEGSNRPVLDGDPVPPEPHREAIEAGFSTAYRFLVENRTALLADGGPLDAFGDAEVRYLVRSTGTYTSILASLTTPEYLRTGLRFGCTVEGLARPFVTGDLDDSVRDVYGFERAALARFDVPRFTATTDGVDLRWGERVVEDFFESPALEQVRDRIRGLDEADLDEQLDYVRMAFGERQPVHRTGSRDRPLPDEVAPDRQYRRRARAIFGRIEAAADRRGEAPTWYRREFGPAGGVNLAEPGPGLYKGRLGIAVFAAALAATTGESRYAAFAEDTAAPVLADLDSPAPFEGRSVGLGPGVGSIAYGFTTLARLLDDDRYAEAARDTVRLVTDDRIERDDQYDVLGGSAGGLLAALAVAEGDDDAAVSRAVACGEHLLDGRIEVDGARIWPTGMDRRPLLGFAHGVAGIAYALARLSAVTGESRFREAAVEAIEYEHRQYDPDRGNWPDRRATTGGEFSHGWCNGPAGIGFARLGTRGTAPTDAVETDLDRALRAVDPASVSPYDHLCCGNAGRIAFRLRAARTLDGPSERSARRLATARLRDVGADGVFSVPFGTRHWVDPTLFSGTAGLGYVLLRLVDPDVPCLLLFE